MEKNTKTASLVPTKPKSPPPKKSPVASKPNQQKKGRLA